MGVPAPAAVVASKDGFLHLSQLNHAIAAFGVSERLRLTIRDVSLPQHMARDLKDVRCKVYVGPLAAILEGPCGRPDKNKLKDFRLDFDSNGCASIEIDVGRPFPQEPWGTRVKFYHRQPSTLFRQRSVAELVDVIPRPMSKVQSATGGSISLEVLRIIPEASRSELKKAVGRVLRTAIEVGVEAADVEDLCLGALELGSDSLRTAGAIVALEEAAANGKVEVVERLADLGVPCSSASARAAEAVGTPSCVGLALRLLRDHLAHDGPCGEASKGAESRSLLLVALDERLPLVAERILDEDPSSLSQLPATPETAARAYAAGAWSVLAALMQRGDTLPYDRRSLLEFALGVGHVRLARACLAQCEGFESMQAAISTCLDHGRVEIVREALEAQWKVRTHSVDQTATSLLTAGPDAPAECGICFEPLFKNTGAMVDESGHRGCMHFTCLDCAEHIQDEAAERLRVWRARRDPRIPQPPGPVCPFCRAPFVQATRLSNPAVDPRSFFRLACMHESPGSHAAGAGEAINSLGGGSSVDESSSLGGSLPPGGVPAGGGSSSQAKTTTSTVSTAELDCKTAISVLAAVLPVSSTRIQQNLEPGGLWKAWCAEAGSTNDHLSETAFLRPGGMLAWLCDHLIDMKLDDLRGSPPDLQTDPERWFRFFDYDLGGKLTQAQLLRGLAKSFDTSALARPETPATRVRVEGVLQLRQLLQALWNEARWADGITLEDFVEPSMGLAKRLCQALPPPEVHALMASRRTETITRKHTLSVEEALAQARLNDMQVSEEDRARAKERAEKQRQALASLTSTRARRGRAGEPGRAGAELLLASLLEANRGSRSLPPSIRILCPFCSAINQAYASQGHRVICGACRSVFAVPRAA